MGPEIHRTHWWFLGSAQKNNIQEIEAIFERCPHPVKHAFLGHQDNVTPFYSQADLVVFPSYRESFGRIIIEAGLFSKPLVSSRVGVAAEIIDDDSKGYLFEPGIVEDLAKALISAINDKLRDQKGSQLHKTVSTLCSCSTHNIKLRSFYQMITNSVNV